MDFKKYEINAGSSGEGSEAAFALLVGKLKEQGKTLAVAESCTGGLIGKLITDVSGASAVFAGGMITYTNHIKINKLGVSAETVERFTEVSFECAAEMAERARIYFECDFGISATGFAGPCGGNEKDPVGTVYLGISTASDVSIYRLSFGGCSREEIRSGTASLAAKMLLLTLN